MPILIPVQTSRVIFFLTEKLWLFDPGEKNLRVLSKIAIEGRRTRLGGANYKEIRHPIKFRQATST
jgi:hypothetical protein